MFRNECRRGMWIRAERMDDCLLFTVVKQILSLLKLLYDREDGHRRYPMDNLSGE